MKQKAVTPTLRRTDRHFGPRWSKIDETMKMRGAAMRCHAACGQTRCRQPDDIATRHASDQVHVSADANEPAGLEQSGDLTPRETDLHELLSRNEARLFCRASGEAPFEYDVHAHHQSAAL
jgi:hypothetical protein